MCKMLLEMHPLIIWMRLFPPFVHGSMEEYYLLPEWRRVQHQFYSYFLFFVDISTEKCCHINKQIGMTEFWHSNATWFFSLFLNYTAHTKNRTVTRPQTLVLTVNQLPTQFNSCSLAILLEVKTRKPPSLHRACPLVLRRLLSQSLYPSFQLSLGLRPWRFSCGSPRSMSL